MIKVNIHEAKAHLSRYLHKVQEGETIVLYKNDNPVALIIPPPRKHLSKKQLFGLGKGMGKITKAFFDELTDKDLPGFGMRSPRQSQRPTRPTAGRPGSIGGAHRHFSR